MKHIKTVEINIDHLNAIENEPDKFVKAVAAALRAGGSNGSPDNQKFQDRAHADLIARGAEIKD